MKKCKRKTLISLREKERQKRVSSSLSNLEISSDRTNRTSESVMGYGAQSLWHYVFRDVDNTLPYHRLHCTTLRLSLSILSQWALSGPQPHHLFTARKIYQPRLTLLQTSSELSKQTPLILFSKFTFTNHCTVLEPVLIFYVCLSIDLSIHIHLSV